MNRKVKHLTLLLFSVVLLSATLFVPRKADNRDGIKKLELGYPVAFVVQDFSNVDKHFSFYPRWQRLDFNNKDYPIKFKPANFMLSLFILFVIIELIVYSLEILDFKIRKLIYKK